MKVGSHNDTGDIRCICLYGWSLPIFFVKRSSGVGDLEGMSQSVVEVCWEGLKVLDPLDLAEFSDTWAVGERWWEAIKGGEGVREEVKRKQGRVAAVWLSGSWLTRELAIAQVHYNTSIRKMDRCKEAVILLNKIPLMIIRAWLADSFLWRSGLSELWDWPANDSVASKWFLMINFWFSFQFPLILPHLWIFCLQWHDDELRFA